MNENITAPQVRVIAEDGTNLGILSTKEALQKAKEVDMDLIMISAEAQPPVCKILEYHKYLFQRKKQEKKAKSGTKKSGLKTFRFGPTIHDHDLQIRLERARGFLKDNNKVKFIVQFRGRQNTHPEVGFELLHKVTQELTEVAKVETEPNKLGNLLSVTYLPK